MLYSCTQGNSERQRLMVFPAQLAYRVRCDLSRVRVSLLDLAGRVRGRSRRLQSGQCD